MKRLSFEDICIDFPIIKGESMLNLTVTRQLNKPNPTKPLFIWTMPGNRTVRDVKEIAMTVSENIGVYSAIGLDVDTLVGEANMPFYETVDEATSDNTKGVTILTEFAKATPELANFVMDVIKGNSPLSIPDGWKFIFISTIDEGDNATWDVTEYYKMFLNREYTTYIPDDEKYRYENIPNYGANESTKIRKYNKKVNVNEDRREEDFDDDVVFVTPEQSLKMIENILCNLCDEDGIAPEEFILVTDDGLVIGYADEFDRDEMYNAIPADSVIDFDELVNGNIVIDMEPFRQVIDELF